MATRCSSSSNVAAAMAMASLLLLLMLGLADGQLQVGFYSKSCPGAESTVASVVRQSASADPTILPALLRLQFHDCFVRVIINRPLAAGATRYTPLVRDDDGDDAVELMEGRLLLAAGVRRVGADQGRQQQRGGGQQQTPGAPRGGDHRGRQVAARGAVPRRRLLRRHRRPRRPRRHRIHRRAVVRRADGAARRQGIEPAGRRRAAGRARRDRRAPLQVPCQRPRREGPRPPQRGAHGGHDGVLLPPGPALQLPDSRRRPRLGPDHPAGLPRGPQIPVRAGGLEHAPAPGPRQRGRLRHLHPPQHPQRLRRHRLRRRALQRHRHRRRRRLLLRPAQQLLRPLLPAGLRRRHGPHGQHRRRHRQQRRRQEGLLQVQLIPPRTGRSIDPPFIAHSWPIHGQHGGVLVGCFHGLPSLIH